MSSFYLIFVGLLIIGFYAASPNTASLHCRKNEIQCVDGEKCIRGSYKCDGVIDCDDSTDELNCDLSSCRYDEHRCNNGSCVAAKMVCDGITDCSDRTDEVKCDAVACKVNEFRCHPYTKVSVRDRKCIPMRWRCDSHIQCNDNSDERFCGPHECPDGQLGCDSGQCVREMFFCDGRKNCADGSDEKDCGYEDSDMIFLNKGPNIYLKIRTKAGLEFTHLLPLSVQIKATGVHNGMKITGLAFDAKRNFLFVSDAGEPAITLVYNASLNWSSRQWIHFVKKGIVSPKDIAFDYIGNNLYWIDSGTGNAEVVNVDNSRRNAIIRHLSNPVALAISPENGVIFIATSGIDPYVSMYGMDGSYMRILDSVQGSPASLAVHPTMFLLYWTDPGEGTISYVNYFSTIRTRPSKILRKNIDRVMSVTVTERDVYFNSGEPEDFTSRKVNRIKNPESEKDEGWNCITSGTKPSGKYECLINNGGCKHICLTPEDGKPERICVCSSGMSLAEDGVSCELGDRKGV